MAVYVVSDIHGCRQRFDRMLKELQFNENDTLYILGDVIDRGKDGISILQEIMKYKNIHMTIGNHEYMMLKYYRSFESNSCSLYDKLAIEDCWNQNRNQYTRYYFEKLSYKKQQRILKFLEELPVAYTNIKVQNQIYYLVHGCYTQELNKNVIEQKDCNGQVRIESFIWDRIREDMIFFQDRCIIVGHTPTLFFQNNKPYEVWFCGTNIMESNIINIDCGCGIDNEFSRLAVIRLEDRKVFYF